MRGYVMLTDGLHKIIDLYSLKGDGFHKWINWDVQQQSGSDVIVFSYELPVTDGSVRFEIYYNTADPTDAEGNIIYTARIIGTGTPSTGTISMATNETVKSLMPYIKYLRVWDGVKPFAYRSVFSNFTYAESLTIADSCTAFGLYICKGDTSLATANIGAGTTAIEQGAFQDCSALININFPATLTSIGYSAFQKCIALESVDLSSCAISTLGQYCFAYCTALQRVSLPSEGLSQIPNYGFSGCTVLTDITIPNSVEYILQGAFMSCTSLTSITIPDSVVYIRQSAFSGCGALQTVTLGSGVKDIQQYAFSNTGITTLKTPAALEALGRCAFMRCSQLTHADLSDSTITILDTQMFYNCTALTECVLPDTVQTIGTETFYGCSSLSSIQLPAALTTIWTSAFAGCTSLDSITIPAGVTLIYGSAFKDCSALALIDMTACSSDIVINSGVFTTIAQGSVITVSSAELKSYIEDPDNGIINTDGRTTVELV